MVVEQSLLDYISNIMGCEYLSDLRFCSQTRLGILADKLERLTPQEEDLREWNDALEYLAGAPPEESAQAAKDHLLRFLKQSSLAEER